MTQLPRFKALELRVLSISPEPFGRFSLNFTQMFLSVRRCAEHMIQLPRLKVTGQGHVIYLSIRVRSISPEFFERLSLSFTQIFLSGRRCAEQMTQLPRLNVTGFTLEYRVRPISLEPFGRFPLNFTQMFLLVRRCAEFMTGLHRLKVKVTLQGHVIYPSIRDRSISPECFERFSLIFTEMFLPFRRCAEHMTQLPTHKVTGQGIYV